MQTAFNNLQLAIDSIRSLSHQLNPAQLKDIGLVPSIKELVKTLKQSRKYKLALQIKGERHLKALDEAVGLSAFRIIQEQLNNIIKHAKATEISIMVIGSSQSLDFEIRDNGVGFDAKKQTKGLGL